MKKLIAIASIMLGIAANAATVDWEAYDIMAQDSGNAAEGYLVYWFDNASFSLASAQAAIASDNLAFLSNGHLADDLTDDTGYTWGQGIDGFGNGQTVEGYLVVLNASTSAEATLAYVSGIETATTGAAGQTGVFYFENLGDTAQASSWTAVNVPEPTSGLLLLLGVAGLALKRKRA